VIKRALFCIVLLGQLLTAQEIVSDRIKGLRVYGSDESGLPATNLDSRPITIEFDVDEEVPPDVHIRVIHCDRDWNTTVSAFVNDEQLNRSKGPLHFDPAPAGVQFYRYHYTVRIPGITGLERLRQSGNYVFEIVDEQWKNVLARGRFFAVEPVLAPSMTVTNRSLPSEINPYNQVNKIEVAFGLPTAEQLHGETLYPLNLKVVDIYRNRQMYGWWRIDSDRPGPHTFVEGYGTTKMKFIVDNVTPGNGYRRLDLRNATEYPPGEQLRPLRGADVSRFQKPPTRDDHGTSVLVVGTRYADYLPYRFELSMERPEHDSVFVVGDFNGWKPSPECAMKYDSDTQRYEWQTTLRRGVYDYQYVVGPNDWITLEGNDWRTINVYSALIYYHDNQYGGFDRIIGFIQRPSPGGNEPTSE
jgi:hypothetical protein